MKRQIPLTERGQALVMIAIAALALFAFTALAIDGSIVFSDRRHSQNASDTAVLAAALAKVQAESKGMAVSWQQAGLDRAADNDYDNSDPVTVVDVQLCSTTIVIDGHQFNCQGLPANADLSQYIHVVIKSVVDLTFAQVLGWDTITNYTTAVSRATTPEVTNWYDGYGIASTHQGCWNNQNDAPFNVNGNSTSFVIGAGVLVSAVCEGENSVTVGGNPSLDTTTGICAPGTTSLPSSDADNLGSPGLVSNCTVPPPDYYTLPAEPQCTNPGSVTDDDNDGVWIATPGLYEDTFPDVQGGQATIQLIKGVYCLEDGLNMGAGWDLTTDRNGNQAHDPATEGVFFFISGGDVQFNGGANVFIHAISSSTNSSFKSEWLNLLMYIPPSNAADVHITGGSGSTFTGTILAPASDVTLQGASDNNGGTVEIDAQIIADIVEITGSTYLEIYYNESNNATTTTNPGIALID